MSAMKFLTDGGGYAEINDGFSKQDSDIAKNIYRQFLEFYKKEAAKGNIRASEQNIFQANFALTIKDLDSMHFVLIDDKTSTRIVYDDSNKTKRLSLESIIDYCETHLGQVLYSFSVGHYESSRSIEAKLRSYIAQIFQTEKDTNKSDMVIPTDIAEGIKGFRKDYPSTNKTAFIIMQFSETKAHKKIVEQIRTALRPLGVIALRADDKEYMDDLFANIRTYMHCCDFGIAVFERIQEDDFNPNVSLEVGYMLGMGKKVLLLKEQTLQTLQTDLAGKLYKPFDIQDIEATVPPVLDKWLADRDFIN